ncbi:MAG: hypothetical protein HC839_00255 [Leptolyngbyaceae cyanobacterium RM2_2_21]|nr:hypothetical protein [Leptolyngbyaceae cyanobacterium RM2_2_21]
MSAAIAQTTSPHDPMRRQAALDAALPQHLNRDVMAQLVGEADAEALFDWLKEMPFVICQRSGGGGGAITRW